MSVLSRIKKILANFRNHGAKRSTSKIKFIVIHFTANDGDSDTGNANYFKKNVVKASAQYFVDSDSITQSVPDNYVAWSVGGSKYGDCAKTGGGKFYGKCTNSNSISIELCDDKKNGKIYPSQKTIENALILTKYLMKKYNVPQSRVIRHFDVNGKRCPGYWCGTAAKNKKWKTEFWNKLSETASTSDKKNDTKKDTKKNVKANSSSVKKSSSKKIAVDGYWGKELTKRLQQIFGCTVDGIVSNQHSSYKSKNPGLASGWEWKDNPKGGSALIKKIQKKVGADVDGYIGTDTIKKIQKWMGCTQDGVLSAKSPCIKKLQKWCNKQK